MPTSRRPSTFIALLVTASLGGAAHGAAQRVVDLPAADRPLPPPTAVFEVGGLDAPEWAAFTSLTDAAFDRQSRLYLLDGRTPRIVLLGADGSHLRDVGREGEGPGEYLVPLGVETGPADDLVLWDSRARSFLRWSPSGEVGGAVRADYTLGQPDGDFQILGDGSVLTGPWSLIAGGHHAYFTSDGVKRAEGELPLLHFRLEDGTLPRVAHRARMPQWEGDDAPSMRFFDFEPSWGPLEGGRIAVHDGPEYEIDIVGAGGAVEAVLRRPVASRPVTEADRERRRERERERVRNREVFSVGAVGAGGVAVPPNIEERIREAWFADRIPAVRRIVTDRRGRIWVERERPDADPDRPGPVDLLTADGRYLGSWDADGPGIPAAFGPDGLAVWLVEGEMEVPVARVMRLPEAAR